MANRAGIEVHHGDEGLGRVLRESHYVVLTLPHTAETDGLLDAARIATLRADAVVVNVGRGEVDARGGVPGRRMVSDGNV